MGTTSNRPLLPILLIAGGVFVLIVAIGGIILFSGGDESSPEVVIPNPEVARVDLSTAKRAYDSGQAVFVDVRDQVSYEDAHIPGARSIPLGEIDSRLTELDPGDWIILYCT